MARSTHYQVPREPGRWRAIGLAVFVHLALLAMLWIGVHWQNETPVAVEAEIWDPQMREAAPAPETVPSPPATKEAAPPTPTPAPPPKPAPVAEKTPPTVDPDIALEQEKKRQREAEAERRAAEKRAAEEKRRAEEKRAAEQEAARKKAQAEEEKRQQQARAAEEQRRQEAREQAAREKAEREKAEKEKAEKAAREKAEKEKADKEKRAREDAARKAAQKAEADRRHAENLQRLQAQAGSGGIGDAPQSQGGRADSDYSRRLGAKIKSNTIFNVPPSLVENPAVEYAIDLLPDGSVRGIRKLRSSGVPGFDEAVARAIERSQPFPPDKSGRVPSSLILSHEPKDQ